MAVINSLSSSSSVLQVVSNQLATLLDVSGTAFDIDDSIPQNDEGVEVITLSITPIYSISNLLIEFTGFATTNGAKSGGALFQDSTANALTAVAYHSQGTQTRSFFMSHIMQSGTTSSTTFKVRIGCDTSTCYVNAANTGGGQNYDGVAATLLTITEFL